jgi:hypothetical protein
MRARDDERLTGGVALIPLAGAFLVFGAIIHPRLRKASSAICCVG